jgi:hypothetical protein
LAVTGLASLRGWSSRSELVEDVQIVIVIDLLHQPADDGLVLF